MSAGQVKHTEPTLALVAIVSVCRLEHGTRMQRNGSQAESKRHLQKGHNHKSGQNWSRFYRSTHSISLQELLVTDHRRRSLKFQNQHGTICALRSLVICNRGWQSASCRIAHETATCKP